MVWWKSVGYLQELHTNFLNTKHVKSDCLGQCFFKYNFLTLKLLSVFSGECYVESVENFDKKGESKNATNENCAIRLANLRKGCRTIIS